MDGENLTLNAEKKTSEEERECNDCGDTENLIATEIVSLFHCVYLNIVGHILLRGSILKRFISEKKCHHDSSVYVGSAADGTFIQGHSDCDIMQVLNYFQSFDTECLTRPLNASDNCILFIADRKGAAPGYVFLYFARKMINKNFFDNLSGKRKKHVSNHLCKVGSPLRNTCFNLCEETREQCIFHTSGPATRVLFLPYFLLCVSVFNKPEGVSGFTLNALTQVLGCLLGEDIHVDIVDVIPYQEVSILNRWLRRKRRHGWPSIDLLHEVSDFTGYLAPVGEKGGGLEGFEWRICYTTVEQKLVHSFNEVQLLLYQQLKAFTKTHLKAGKKVLTSYVLKNIVFWLSESVPGILFQHRYFVALFRSTLVVLQSCINKCYLPNYIIPERNLLGQIISNEQKQDILSALTGGIKTYPIHEWRETAKNQLCQDLRNISDPSATKELFSFVKKLQFMQLYLYDALEANPEKFTEISDNVLSIFGFFWTYKIRLAKRNQQPTAPDLD